MTVTNQELEMIFDVTSQVTFKEGLCILLMIETWPSLAILGNSFISDASHIQGDFHMTNSFRSIQCHPYHFPLNTFQ